jgi:cholest-4-en-3-one 26-monooxygenase
MTKTAAGLIDVLGPDVYGNGDPETNGLPLERYARLREEAPCYLHPLNDPALIDSIWVLTRYADIVRVDQDAENFINGGELGVSAVRLTGSKSRGGMVYADGADHRRHRDVTRSAFTPRAVAAYAAGFRVLARSIVANALENESFDFVPEVSVPMPLNALCELLEVPEEDRPDLLGWANAFAIVTDPAYAPTPEESAAAVGHLAEYSLKLARTRKHDRNNSLMSKILDAVDAGAFSEAELQGLIIILAGAGTDTTRNTLSHTLHELMRNPEQMAWLRAHADDIPREAVQEMVRWASPLIHFARTVVNDTEIAGQELRAGEFVAMLFPAGNFDPAAIDDAETFDLTRTVNRHVSFGVGPHSCLGKHVAALEIKILLEELLQNTAAIEPNGPITYIRDSRLRGVHSLPVTVKRA